MIFFFLHIIQIIVVFEWVTYIYIIFIVMTQTTVLLQVFAFNNTDLEMVAEGE